MAKGIRVNQLAKELGVASKVILDWCKANDLADVVPNHQSNLKLGLVETLRGVFGGGGVATAEGSPDDEAADAGTEATAEAPKPSRPKARKATAHADDAAEVASNGDAAPVAPEAPAVLTPATAVATTDDQVVTPAVRETADVLTTPAVATPEAPVPGTAVATPTPIAEAPATPPPPPAADEPSTAAAATVAPPPAPRRTLSGMSGASTLPPPGTPRILRPPVRIGDPRPGTPGAATPPGPVAERKPIIPAPQMVRPEAAKIQGPNIVRVEKPDIVAAPRSGPRRPEGGPSTGSAFNPSRPRTGAGVKPATGGTTEEEGGDDRKAGAKPGSPRSNSGRRRGEMTGRSGEAVDKIKEFSEKDLTERRRRVQEAAKNRQQFNDHLNRMGHRGQSVRASKPTGPIEVEQPITVRSLAAALGIKGGDLLQKLIRQGIIATINHSLDDDTAAMLALEFGQEIAIKEQPTLEEALEAEFNARERDPAKLVTRPAVVTILGHVDHGKTSLLDKIRHANVAAGEAGGITQHTAAWMVEVGQGDAKKRVTFIDTPGHQAFTSMRARGANMTDVVVLVASAAEGVQPQTVESINHARAAEVPIVVALNKIDRPDANPDMVLGQLAAQQLNPVEWGGDTEVIRTSATTGQGIPELIDILDYQSQLLELKADPTAPARGTVIESFVDAGLGPVATVLVQDGTLNVGDVVLSGPGYGRIRSLLNDRREPIPSAGPSTPVIISGLDQLPSAGDKFFTVADIERARSIAEERSTRRRQESLLERNKVTTANNLNARIKEGNIRAINLIIKGDVQGSVETLVNTVTASNTDEVKIRVIHSGVGGINESDVELAIATKTKPTDNEVAIVGFHVIPDEAARALAEQHHVDVKLYKVIYELFDDLKKRLSGLLEPEIREKLHGHVEVRQVIKVSKIGNVGGCFVTDGHILRGSKVRLVRGGVVITEDLSIASLKRVKDDVREVKAGLECGIKLDGYDDIKIGDVFEGYIREEFQRTL